LATFVQPEVCGTIVRSKAHMLNVAHKGAGGVRTFSVVVYARSMTPVTQPSHNLNVASRQGALGWSLMRPRLYLRHTTRSGSTTSSRHDQWTDATGFQSGPHDTSSSSINQVLTEFSAALLYAEHAACNTALLMCLCRFAWIVAVASALLVMAVALLPTS
jgi:hypothetical protein